jgi:hypothetical protein
MIVVLQVAGVLAALIGVVALYYGIPVKEFSFGNTLILVGTLSLCTGAILFGLSVVALELRMMVRRLTSARPQQDPRARPTTPAFPAPAGALNDGSATFEQGAATSVQVESPDPAIMRAVPEPVPSPKPKRSLLFQSSMRRDRERAEGRADEPTARASETGETPPPDFEEAWPKGDRARGSEMPPQRRSSRLPPQAEASEAGTADQAAVTVLKSGVVDGMGYSLYSDGSIEAQMPEGMMRFASIDELRAHLDHRP